MNKIRRFTLYCRQYGVKVKPPSMLNGQADPEFDVQESEKLSTSFSGSVAVTVNIVAGTLFVSIDRTESGT